MFRILFTVFALSGALLLYAQNNAPKIFMAYENKTPAVEDTGKLLRIQTPSARNTADTPPGSLAARIAEENTMFEWSPSQDPARITGGAHLADAALSPDESTLVIAERIGGSGPNSTRLVFFNLCNDKLVRAIELKQRKLAAIAFSPAGGSTLWAVEEEQPLLSAPARVIGIDLLSGKIESESMVLENTPAGFAVADKLLWVSLPDSESLLQFRLASPDAPPQKIRSRIAGATLQLTPDARTLLLAGAGRIERFRVTGTQTEFTGGAPLPSQERPGVVIPVTDDGSGFAVASPEKPAYLISGGAARQLDENSGGTGCFRRKEGELLLAVMQKQAIKLFPADSTVAAATVSPGNLRPFNKNENWKLFALSGEKRELLLIDHRGNISRLEIRPRRWEKTELFKAQ